MRFQNEDESLELKIVNYELSEGEGDPTGDDQNWLVLRAVWKHDDGEVTVDSNSCLLTYELQEMTAGLKVLNAGIKDSYESYFTEPYFALAADAEGENFRVYVSFYLPNTMDGDDTAELKVLMSREEMSALIKELDQYCGKFPDRK